MEKSKICRRCVLVENGVDVRLNQEGVCNICLDYSEGGKTDNLQRNPLESGFIKILNKTKGKGEYDCLVMCSGGKDSTAALYFMKKRYKLNALAFTFDHSFESKEALENVKNAAEALKADFLYFKSEFMKEMFCDILKNNSKAVLCHVCSIWYMDIVLKAAARFKIPVIIGGWTKGQCSRKAESARERFDEKEKEFASMSKETKEFLNMYKKTNPKYRDFPLSMREAITRAGKKHKCVILSPHWFLPFESEEYVEIIKKELGWKYAALSYPAKSTNCELNFISVYNSIKYFGYTHYHVEMAKMVREGVLDREEALKNLEINFDKTLLNKIAAKLDYRFD